MDDDGPRLGRARRTGTRDFQRSHRFVRDIRKPQWRERARTDRDFVFGNLDVERGDSAVRAWAGAPGSSAGNLPTGILLTRQLVRACVSITRVRRSTVGHLMLSPTTGTLHVVRADPEA